MSNRHARRNDRRLVRLRDKALERMVPSHEERVKLLTGDAESVQSALRWLAYRCFHQNLITQEQLGLFT